MYKHKKHRNTGLIFEQLLAQMTADLIAGKPSPAAKIVQKHFSESAELYQELELFLTVNALRQRKVNEQMVNDVLDMFASRRKALKSLDEAKYKLIRDIKATYDLKEFLQIKVPRYRQLAVLNEYFDGLDNPSLVSPIKMATLKEAIRVDIADKIKPETEFAFKGEEKGYRLLGLKLIQDEFNKRWEGVFSPQDRALLAAFSKARPNDKYLPESMKVYCSHLRESLAKITHKPTFVKIDSLISILESQKEIEEPHISSALKLFGVIANAVANAVTNPESTKK